MGYHWYATLCSMASSNASICRVYIDAGPTDQMYFGIMAGFLHNIRSNPLKPYIMKTLNININNQEYSIEHPITTINLYRVKHMNGLAEITRNRHNGKWKVLYKNESFQRIPVQGIGRAIEKNLSIIN